MASKMVSGLGKLGRRVAAATADRARNTRAMLGFIARCYGVVPPGTTSLTLEESQYYLGRQMEHEIEQVRQSDDDNVRRLVDLDAKRKERDRAVVEVYCFDQLEMAAWTRQPAKDHTAGPGCGIPTSCCRRRSSRASTSTARRRPPVSTGRWTVWAGPSRSCPGRRSTRSTPWCRR